MDSFREQENLKEEGQPSTLRSRGSGFSTYAGWIVLVGAILNVTALFYDFAGEDQPTFAYFGAAILRGEVLYRDVWDVVSPGTFLVYALGMLLLGKSYISVNLLDAIWQIATALALGKVAVEASQRKVGGTIAGLAYLGCYYSHRHIRFGEPEGFVSLPVALAFFFLLRAFESDRWRHWAAAAFFVGVASLISTPYGLVGIVFLLAATFQQERAWRSVLLRWMALAAGVIVPLGAFAIYLFWHGAAGDFWTSQFVIAAQYVQRHRNTMTLACIFESSTIPSHYPTYILGLGWLVMRGMARPRSARRSELLLAAWLGIALFTLILHAAYLPYHFIPLVAPLAVLASDAWVRLPEEKGRLKLLPRLVIAALLLLFLVMPSLRWAQRARFTWDWAHGHRVATKLDELVTHVRVNSSPDDTITVWGGQISLYLLADRRSGTRYPNPMLLTVHWKNADMRPSFLADFRSSRPKFLILMTRPPGNPCYRWFVRPAIAFQDFGEFRTLVEADYEKVKVAPEYTLFRRKDASAQAPQE